MKIGLTLLLLLTSMMVRADPGLVAAAEHASATGDYRLAVQDYGQVLRTQGYSASVLFNLGNAWLRLGKPGHAILNYEQALVLMPGNATIESNLAAAQQHAGITPLPVSSWLATARYVSFDTYVWAALAAVWILCISIVLLCVRSPMRRFARPLIVIAAIILCVSADAAVMCWQDLYRAIVVSAAALLLAPAESAAGSGALHEGEVVWIEGRYASFNLVRTAEGHTGWVANDAAVPVRTQRR